MKFKITRQVPGVLRFEFAALEIDGEMKDGGAATTEFFDAVTAADRWAEEQRGKLSEAVLRALTQDGQQPPFQPRPAPAQAPSASRPAAAPAASQPRPAPSSEKASEIKYGPLGFPSADYKALIDRICGMALRDGVPVLADAKFGRSKCERDFVRAAAWNRNEKTGKEYHTIKNTMPEYAADIIGRFPAWGAQAVSHTWERLVNLAKALEADGHVELSVSMFKDGAIAYQQVSYSLPDAGAGDGGGAGHDFGPGADEVPF